MRGPSEKSAEASVWLECIRDTEAGAMKTPTFKSISASQGATVDTLNTALSPWCRVHDKADPALHRSPRSPRKLRRSFMTGRKGDKQRQGVSSRKPLLTLLLGSANIGQKREQAIPNLSWSFKLECDAEDRHKRILMHANAVFPQNLPAVLSSSFLLRTGWKRVKHKSKRKTKQSTLKTSKHSKLEFNWSRVQKLVSLLSR